MTKTEKKLTGWHVFAIFGGAFGVIIAVNIFLAFSAVRTFPGLETSNSYVASQNFDADRTAQQALGWDVGAVVKAGQLRLSITRDGQPVDVEIQSAVLGRATHVAEDQAPVLTFDGTAYVAPVALAAGNWNLRLVAVAPDGTPFRQRVIVRTAS